MSEHDRTNGQGVVRLSLNVPAVERLIAGDQELEVALRQQVKRQVFDNTLDRLMQTPEIKKMIENTRSKIDAEIAAQIGTIRNDYSTNYREKFTMAPAFKKALDEAFNNQIQNLIAQMVKEKLDRFVEQWALLSDEKINKALDQAIEKRINDGINARLAAAAAQLKGA